MSEHRWALLVGVGGYRGHPSLKYAAADAVDFTKEIVRRLGFDRKRVLVLADPEDEADRDLSPTRNNLFHALGLFAEKSSELYRDNRLDPMGEEDLFLFYFSGHGMRTEDQAEHLLGIDASPYNVRDTAIPLESVIDRIEHLPCRHKVLFLDACRDEFFDSAGAKSADGSKGIGEPSVVEREGLATFYSCDPKRRSYEIEALKHGSFTYCLLEAIKHENINTLEELDEYLKSRVPTVNADGGKEPQQPYAVPKPADMMKLALFQTLRGEEEHGDLIDMTNELFQAGVIDFEWWDKLTGIWEDGSAPNFALKERIFRELYAGSLSLSDFEARWRRTERHIGSLAVRPDIGKLGQSSEGQPPGR